MKQILILYFCYFEPMSLCIRTSRSAAEQRKVRRQHRPLFWFFLAPKHAVQLALWQYGAYSNRPSDSMGPAQITAGWQHNWIVHSTVQLVHRQFEPVRKLSTGGWPRSRPSELDWFADETPDGKQLSRLIDSSTLRQRQTHATPSIRRVDRKHSFRFPLGKFSSTSACIHGAISKVTWNSILNLQV